MAYGAAVLAAIGDLVEDVVVWLDGPIVRGADAPARVQRRRGGSAANVCAFAAARGFGARFIGEVGDDPTGNHVVAELASTGCDVRVSRSGRTGAIVVLVDDTGERSFLSDRGASTGLARVDDDALEGVAVVYVPAYSLNTEPLASTCIDAMARARGFGAKLAIGTSSVTVIDEFGVGRFRSLLERLAPDVVIGNSDEAAAARLSSEPLKGMLTVVTDGSRPTRVGDLRVPVPSIGVVRDTTGAGDAFTAGFLTAWSRGVALVKAIECGHSLSAEVLIRQGVPE